MLKQLLLLSAILTFPISAHAFCFEEAAGQYGLDPSLLRAIAKVESGMNPSAISRNTNGTYDYGLMQINTSWAPVLKRNGIPWEAVGDPCSNVIIGAWILRQKINAHGYNWRGIAAYHSLTPNLNVRYANKIAKQLKNPSRGEDI